MPSAVLAAALWVCALKASRKGENAAECPTAESEKTNKLSPNASRVLSPAAEAFRYFILEHGEAHLAAHDDGLLPPPRARRKTSR